LGATGEWGGSGMRCRGGGLLLGHRQQCLLATGWCPVRCAVMRPYRSSRAQRRSTLGHPHAVALRFVCCDQLATGLAPVAVRPCWGHELKADFSLDSFVLRDFSATEAALGVTMLAYNWMSVFRHAVMRQTCITRWPRCTTRCWQWRPSGITRKSNQIGQRCVLPWPASGGIGSRDCGPTPATSDPQTACNLLPDNLG